MSEERDSIQKFYSELPNYSSDDIYNGIPYDRALALCKDQESMEECLTRISKMGESLAVPKDVLDAYFIGYMKDFLLSCDINPDDIPEDVLEYATQQARIKELELELKKKESEEKGTSVIAENTNSSAKDSLPAGVVYLPDYLQAKNTEQSFPKYCFGGKEFSLDFGKFIVNDVTGRITYYERNKKARFDQVEKKELNYLAILLRQVLISGLLSVKQLTLPFFVMMNGMI